MKNDQQSDASDAPLPDRGEAHAQEIQQVPEESPTIEQLLDALLVATRAYDASADNWQEQRKWEERFNTTYEALEAADVRFLYSERAGRFLHQRYHLVGDGDDGGVLECWTLLDTEAEDTNGTYGGRGAPVLIDDLQTPTAHAAARVLGLRSDPVPAFLHIPMKSAETRRAAQELCERWNLAAAQYCPGCASRFSGEEGLHAEQTYQDLSLLRCRACRAKQEDGQHHAGEALP